MVIKIETKEFRINRMNTEYYHGEDFDIYLPFTSSAFINRIKSGYSTLKNTTLAKHKVQIL